MTRIVWAFINQLKRLSPPEYYHTERKTMRELSFDNNIRRTALAHARTVSSSLRVWQGTEPNFSETECSIDHLL